MTDYLKLQLPDLPPKTGRVGDLARVLFSGDETAIGRLYDALLDEGRTEDAKTLKQIVAELCVETHFWTFNSTALWSNWQKAVRGLLSLFLYDLYELDDVVEWAVSCTDSSIRSREELRKAL